MKCALQPPPKLLISHLFHITSAHVVAAGSTPVITFGSEAVWHALEASVHLHSIKIKAWAHLSINTGVMDIIQISLSALLSLNWSNFLMLPCKKPAADRSSLSPWVTWFLKSNRVQGCEMEMFFIIEKDCNKSIFTKFLSRWSDHSEEHILFLNPFPVLLYL